MAQAVGCARNMGIAEGPGQQPGHAVSGNAEGKILDYGGIGFAADRHKTRSGFTI